MKKQVGLASFIGKADIDGYLTYWHFIYFLFFRYDALCVSL
jgi:hypothetical protein